MVNMASNPENKVQEMKNNFVIQQMEDFKSGEYSASDLSGCFGDSFKDWSKVDFELCHYNKLVQLRKVLRDRGVYVDTGRTKDEVITALMAAVKSELPWPESPEKFGPLMSGKRKSENTTSPFARKSYNFQPRRKVEDDQSDTKENLTSLFARKSYNFQPKFKVEDNQSNTNIFKPTFEFQPRAPNLPFEAESSRRPNYNMQRQEIESYSKENTPQTYTIKQNITFEKELGIFLRFYTNDELKYSGEPNDSIKFKYNIFLDNCTRSSLPKTAYRTAIPTMFTKSALQRYFATCQKLITHEEVFTSLQQYFENDEHKRNMLRQWNSCSLNTFIRKYPNRSLTEVLKLMIDELSQLQFSLDDMYQGDKSLYNKLIETCRQEPACQLACFRPSINLQGLINDLYSSVATFEDSSNKPHSSSEAFITDRKYHNSDGNSNRFSFSRTLPSSKRGETNWKNKNQRKCYVCGAKGCWSSRHSESERQRSRENFLEKLKNRANQYFAEADVDQDPDLSDIEKRMDSLIMETTDIIQENEKEEPESTEQWITSFGAITDSFAYSILTELQDTSTAHIITKENNTTTEVNPFTYVAETRYNTENFHGIMIDTGASLCSTAGYGQYLALNNIIKIKINHNTAGKVNVQFGIGNVSSIGSVDVSTPIGIITFHIVKADTPFIMCLKDMDSMNVYFNNLKDTLIQGSKRYPVARTFGHPFLILPNTIMIASFLTDFELRQLHRRFGHPSVNRLIHLLDRSGHNNNHNHRRILENIEKFCHHCQKHGRSPTRFKFTIKEDVSFNHTIYVDVMYINGEPILHIVDEATKFQAARWLKDMSAISTWNAIRQCWIDVYVGPPDIIIHDSGSNFTANEFQASSASMTIITKCVPVEAHNSMGLVERYHAPLRRAYSIISAELKEDGNSAVQKSIILQVAVKSVNDTAGPNGLVPTLLVFGTYPRMTYLDPPAPSIVQRARAIKKAMEEVSKLNARRQVTEALRTRNGPQTNKIHSIHIGGQVLVWRIHKKQWDGPYELLDMNNETATIQLPHGPTQFRSTSVKPYNTENSNSKSTSQDEKQDSDNNLDTHIKDSDNELDILPLRRNPPRNKQLPQRFRQDDKANIITTNNIDSASIPSNFVESRQKEIDGLIASNVFEIINVEDIPENSRIFKTRFVDQIKHEGTPEAYYKSRLVVQAYNDTDKQTILTQAPTIQRASQRILLCCAMIIPDMKVALRDISQAYTQSTTHLERNIFVRPVKELEMPPNKLLRVARPLYGIPEAGTHWFNTYQKHHIEKLNMETSTYDTCLLSSKNDNKTNLEFGIVGLQTDDTLTVGNEEFLRKETEEIIKAGFLHKPLEILSLKNNLNFNGSIISLTNDTILVSQKRQISRIELIDVRKSQDMLKTYYIAQRARGAYVATVTQPEASFSLSHAAQIKQPSIQNIKNLNKCLAWQKRNIDRGIKFVKLDIDSIRIIVFTDSAFANNADYSSQIGYVIVLADKYNRANLLHWSSTKCRRVTRSVLASELYGLVNGFDMGSAIKSSLEKILKPWHPGYIPLIVCTDSKSLYDCLVKIGTTNEKRLMIDIMSLRQAYEQREITEIMWIPGHKNPSDAMTKDKEKCCNALKEIIDNNFIDLDPCGWVQRT